MPARADQRDRDLTDAVRTVDRDDTQVGPVDDEREGVVAPLTFRPAARKGRGAVMNLQGRYEVDVRERYDDGWEAVDGVVDEADAPLKTTVTIERAKTILSRNESPDIPFRLSLNPYRGCEHVMWRKKVLPDSGLTSLPGFF